MYYNFNEYVTFTSIEQIVKMKTKYKINNVIDANEI